MNESFDPDTSPIVPSETKTETESDIASKSEEIRVPFDPDDRTQVKGKGCGWMAAVGCGVVILAGAALVAAIAFNSSRILAWSVGQFEKQIMAELPDDMAEADREELRQAFQTAREAMKSGEVDPQALQGFQSIMLELAFKPAGERAEEDYRRLAKALRDLAGEAPPQLEDAVFEEAGSVARFGLEPAAPTVGI